MALPQVASLRPPNVIGWAVYFLVVPLIIESTYVLLLHCSCVNFKFQLLVVQEVQCDLPFSSNLDSFGLHIERSVDTLLLSSV